MTDMEIPDPEEAWCDASQAAVMLGRSRATVYDMALRGLLTQRAIGRATVYYRPEVRGVAQALERLAGRA